MSNSKLSELLPANVRFYPEAEEDFLALDRGRQIKVIKALDRIAKAPRQLGKPLENQPGRLLAGFRSIYVDKKSIRIVWQAASSGEVEVAVVAGIAERDGLFVYDLVAKRRQEVESLVARVVNSLPKASE